MKIKVLSKFSATLQIYAHLCFLWNSWGIELVFVVVYSVPIRVIFLILETTVHPPNTPWLPIGNGHGREWSTHIQYIPRNMQTVFALLCLVVVIHWLIFPYPLGLLHWHCGNLTIAIVRSLDCHSASKATLMNMYKYFMWIHYERLHNHNKAKHSKTVCIFLGIYCNYRHATPNTMDQLKTGR